LNKQHQTIVNAIARRHAKNAGQYAEHAFIFQEVGRRLLERLEWVNFTPDTMLDVGAGQGDCLAQLRERYPSATAIATDSCFPLLSRQSHCVAADAHHLPFTDNSMDMVVANGVLPWLLDPPAFFESVHRLLKPKGLLMFSSFGPNTLIEWREAWAQIDDYSHVPSFVDMHDLGDLVRRVGYADVVVDVETIQLRYDDIATCCREMKALGFYNFTDNRRPGLTGKQTFARLEEALVEASQVDGKIVMTFEVIYGHAWGTDSAVQQQDEAGDAVISLQKLRRQLRNQ
jgi:malonyl-CoA O-methyltransferase